jgi:hypothetical protein
MKRNPLSGFSASPFSHAARGKGDDARAAGRPLHGVPCMLRSQITVQ